MTDVTIGSAYRILGYFENCQADHILPKNELLRRFEKDGGSPLDFVVGLQQAIDRGWLKASRDIITLTHLGLNVLNLIYLEVPAKTSYRHSLQ